VRIPLRGRTTAPVNGARSRRSRDPRTDDRPLIRHRGTEREREREDFDDHIAMTNNEPRRARAPTRRLIGALARLIDYTFPLPTHKSVIRPIRISRIIDVLVVIWDQRLLPLFVFRRRSHVSSRARLTARERAVRAEFRESRRVLPIVRGLDCNSGFN